MPLRFLVAAPLVVLLVGCSDPSGLVEVPAGRWGGDHVALVVEPASAQLELDCAHGSVPGSIPVRDGAFDVAGVFVPEHGGPIRQGEVLPQHAARYRGTTDGQSMTLTIDVPGLGSSGPFSLGLGRSPRITKCL